MGQGVLCTTAFESQDFDLCGGSYGLFTRDCRNWDSQGWFACFRIFSLDTERISKNTKHKSCRGKTTFPRIGKNLSFGCRCENSGARKLGLEIWAGSAGLESGLQLRPL